MSPALGDLHVAAAPCGRGLVPPGWVGQFPTGPTCFFARRWEPKAWDLEAVAADPVWLLLVPSRDEGAAEVGHHSPVLVGRSLMEG